MIHEIDAALRLLLDDALPAGTAIRFEPPGPSCEEPGRPVLDAFLYEVREDVDGRAGGWIELRDEDGRLVARRPPPRRYRLCYLVTAWASEVDAEHSLLGAALAALSAHDTVPARHLHGASRDAGLPVMLSVADPELPSAPMDIWSALGTAPRSALNLVVTAPLPQPALTELAKAPESVSLGVAGAPRPAPPRPAHPVPRKQLRETY